MTGPSSLIHPTLGRVTWVREAPFRLNGDRYAVVDHPTHKWIIVKLAALAIEEAA